MQKKYPYCSSFLIDLGEVWVFRFDYKNEVYDQKHVTIHYVWRETLELIHTEEIVYSCTFLSNNCSAPHFQPFYHAEIEKKKEEKYKDFVLHVTTLIVPFSHREVSLHFLL